MSEVAPNPTLSYATPQPAKPSKAMVWTGRVLTTLIGLAIGMGGVTDIVRAEIAVKGLADAGFPPEILVPLGVVTVAVAVLLLIPQTAVLGGLFMLCYLGGAVVIHLHAGQYGQMFVPVAFGVVLWIGLLLREPRLRSLLPLRTL